MECARLSSQSLLLLLLPLLLLPCAHPLARAAGKHGGRSDNNRQWQRRLASAAAAVASAADDAASGGPWLTWASFPVHPGDVVLVEGSGLPGTGPASVGIRALAASTNVTAAPVTNQSSVASFKVALPTTLPLDVYELTIGGGPGASILVNAPEVWSFQGDLGNTSTPGGTLRLFGRALALVATEPSTSSSSFPPSSPAEATGAAAPHPRPSAGAAGEEARLAAALVTALRTCSSTPAAPTDGGGGDGCRRDDARRLMRKLEALWSQAQVENAAGGSAPPARSVQPPPPVATAAAAGAAVAGTLVQLQPVNSSRVRDPRRGNGDDGFAYSGEPLTLVAVQADNYSATVVLPPSLAPGEYALSMSNNGGAYFAPVDVFVSPERPRVASLVVRPALALKTDAVFPVPRPPAGVRYPTCKGRYGTGPGDAGRAFDSSPDVQAALNAAAANGGGVVAFPHGQFWLSRALAVPPGVVVRGAGRELTSLYFREDTRDTAPKPSYVYSTGSSAPGPHLLFHNASGPVRLLPAASDCGAAGCCLAPSDASSPSAAADGGGGGGAGASLVVRACDNSTAQAVHVIALAGGAEGQLAWGGRCLGTTDGDGGAVTLNAANCGREVASWTLQAGLAAGFVLLQAAAAVPPGCLTVDVPREARAQPGAAVRAFQCWHVNATSNFAVPGVGAVGPAPAPAPAAPSPSASTTAWGVEDLTLYITHWYNGVFTLSPEAEFTSIRRVRVRANPWFAENPAGRQASTRGRTTPYAVGDMFNSHMILANAENFEVSDCDLYAAGGSVVYSSLAGPARFGLVARNRIFNGMTAHWFDNARNVIFEDNWMTGASLTAYGSNMDTYGGGYAHGVVLRNNTYESVWGNDREITTFDNAGGCYLGPVGAVDTTAAGSSFVSGTGGAPRAGECGGGAVVILNGTGAGQIRRVVAQGMTAAGNANYTLDRPFDAPPAAGSSWMQVMPFRGRALFLDNTYRDTGAVQFYGIGLDCVVAGCVGERMGGFLSWGQWRGYDANGVSIPAPSSGGGGDGANPNLHVQFLHNHVAEGNTVVDYNGQFDDTSGGFGCFLNGSSFVVTDTTHWAPDGTGEHFHGVAVPRLGFPLNSMVVFRGNLMDSNSGIRVERLAQDVLLDSNVALKTDAAVTVTNDCVRVLVV